MTQLEQRGHLVEMLQKFENGVLVTKTNSGNLHGRPMQVARVEADGTVYLNTSIVSPKVSEIEADSNVGVYFQESRQWVSLSGTAEIVQDRELIRSMWKEAWRVWFPDGKESQELALIRITPSEGEYWDVTGERGVRFAWETLKAYVTGRTPDRGAEGNAKIAM